MYTAIALLFGALIVVEDWKLVEVERNLFEKFRGLTCFPTNLPLRGLWTKGGLVYQDNILLYIVIE